MKRKYLIVIDMQNDFVTGSLGSSDARKIVDAMAVKLEDFNGELIFTKDTHGADYLKTQEGANLPVEHCIRGSLGHDLVPELQEICEKRKARVFEKNTFGSQALATYLKEQWDKNEIQSIALCGVCTDICVISNALLIKATIPECPLIVLKDLCAGLSRDKHAHALDVLNSCQIATI